ncbi:hypothetical protein DB346_16835 [Verrucomicrobia bacterium LW23]|nr:hypothetical protein DB346_16835 [Verrucomicrobia bacterium LW23]
MKRNPYPCHLRSPGRHFYSRLRRGQRRGFALVIVLGVLVLMSIMVLAMLSSAQMESRAAHGFAQGASARRFADSALNVVMSQIADATQLPDANWISQPGLIRVYSGVGDDYTGYKLYSSDNMRLPNFNPGTSNFPTDVPGDWKTRPAEFVDLNSPVRSSGTAIYPIAAPDTTLGTKGFSFPATGDLGISMPVRWIYVLQDGTLGEPSAASPANPIIGRVAFWADDESTKVNINTAAGDEWAPAADIPGSFMDMPRFNNSFEKNSLGQSQPRQGEFQRYPGHPATTFLSAVFPTLTRDQLAAINPRINGGGSKGGTVNNTTLVKLNAKSDRLYATVDELFYGQPTPTATVRPTTVLTDTQISNAQFFLTAQSRAPEVNVFNRPRVTIWPIAGLQADSNGSATLYGERTAFDKAIAFASTVGDKKYYFVRNDSTHPTDDFTKFPRNREIYQYLQGLTALIPPGYTSTFLAKYGEDRDQILTEIFDYVRCTNLSDSNLPVGKRFTLGPNPPTPITSAPAGSGQVVPIEITAPTTGTATRGFGRISTVHSPTLLFYPTRYVPNNKVTPQNNGKTKEVRALFLIQSFSVAHGVMRLMPNYVYEVEGLNNLTLEGQPLGFPAKARVSYSGVSPFHDYGWGSFEGAANLFWNAGTVRQLGSDENSQYTLFSNKIAMDKTVFAEYPPFTNENAFGSYMSLGSSGGDITIRVYSRDKANAVRATPIQTIRFQFPPTANLPTPRVVTGVGGSVSAATAPVEYNPQEKMSNRAFSTNQLIQDNYQNPAGGNSVSLSENDPVRSVEPATGDARLIAAMKNVPAAAFQKDADYDKKLLYASDMRCGNGLAYRGRWGRLVKDAGYNYVNPSTFFPAVPSFLNGANLIGLDGQPYPGDWDNGMGGVVDGPYINRPDEGEISTDAYYSTQGTPVQTTLFSPNRQVPSPVMFGSLSTGVKRSETAFNASNTAGVRPWQTLLFCPNPPAKDKHPGKADPPDHLILDLFTMPVVEPFAISEPFSTMGKINLNAQIVPFTYIERTTGLHAVLRSTRLAAVPTTEANRYKSGAGATNYRARINTEETLKAFKERYDNNQPFKTASEICDMFLVPETVVTGSVPTINNMRTWWDSFALTGDNSREKPYADIYPRLTTKSNSFRVHIRAQSLKKVPGTNPDEWVEGRDVVEGEWRGSIQIERYLNPALTTYDETQPLTGYKFRTLGVKRFDP